MRVLNSARINSKGYTLTELMIVLAIISALAAIAYPSYQSYVIRAKMQEAKLNLASLFASERAYAGNWQIYFADFRNIGFIPLGRLAFNVGFGATGSVNALTFQGPATQVAAGGAAVVYNSELYCTANPTQCAQIYPGLALPGGCTVNGAVYLAGAVGQIDGDATLDTWTIDSNKNLRHTVDDSIL